MSIPQFAFFNFQFAFCIRFPLRVLGGLIVFSMGLLQIVIAAGPCTQLTVLRSI